MNRFSRDPKAAAASSRSAGAGRAQSTPAAEAESSPEEARRLLEEVQKLGSRMRHNRQRAQQIDRRAAAYASRLARHTARLLQHMPNAVPAVRPVPGTGASTLRHYVLKHDQLDAPDRMRLLVVSSDGRLRVCTVLTDNNRSRLWNDYEVANPPLGLGLSIVFEGLSSLIVKLETAVSVAEATSNNHESAVDDMIAESEAKLAHAGSRLSSVEERLDGEEEDEGDEEDVYLGASSGELRSHGFEHRLPFATPPAKPRFQR